MAQAESSESPPRPGKLKENPHESIWNRPIPRRRVLAAGVAGAAGVAAASFGLRGLLKGGQSAGEGALPENEPAGDRYDVLASKIEKSQILSEEKAQYLAQVEKYRDIEEVQARFMRAYTAKMGPDGKTPELLYYSAKLWPTFENLRPEDQIFLLRNERLLSEVIRADVDSLVSDFSLAKMQEVFDVHNRRMHNMGSGDVPYVGINLPLDLYLAFKDPELAPRENLTFSGFGDGDLAKLKKIQETLGPIFGNYKISRAKSYSDGDNASEVSLFDAQVDKGDTGEIKVKPKVPGDVEHEFAHATNLAQNKWIALHFLPEDLIEAATEHTKVLCDPVYGVQFGSLDFLGKDVSGVTKGISAYPMTVIVANDSGSGGGEIYPKGEISDFAKNRSTGQNISEDEFRKLVNLPAGENKRVKNWQEFIGRQAVVLDKLAGTSDYYAWVINFIKADPARADRLNGWNMGKGSPAFGANAWDAGYFNAIREYFDGVFIVALFSGDEGARKVFDGLKEAEKREFLAGAVRILERASEEQWAYGTAHAIANADTGSPFLNYYKNIVSKYK